MKKIILILSLACAGILNASAQTRVVVRTPARRVVVTRRPVVVPVRAVVVTPVRTVVVRPAAAVVVARPTVVRRRVVVVRH
ncbi:hypothetical protein [Mucilaginibacter sp.]|jgi:hypothetical protein|uniref:hypothetical protein n=1 Tax=Mucilaginibacter sp. TaxID=1882438 RepID=UPI00356926CC